MLRKILILGTLTAIVNVAFAQLDYGVKVGLNHANVVRTDVSSNFREYKQSFHLGGYASLNLGEKLITQVELLYSNKGYKSGPTNISEESHTNLNYINMPVLLRYELLNKITFNFGPELGYLISAFGREGYMKQDQNAFWDNKLDLGALVGLGINIHRKLILDFRYVHGLRSVARDFIPTIGNNERLIYLNRTFQLSLQFSLQK